MCIYLYMHYTVQRSTICNNLKLKINQMFINNRMGKQSLIYAYNRILYFNENGLYTTTNDNMAKSHKHNSELKKINTKEYICMSPFR